MSDLTLAGSITRTLLGLPDLNLNDWTSYFLSRQLWGAQEQWERNVVSSPYVDGQVTVNRYRPNMRQPVGIEVLGPSQSALEANILAVKQAFFQDSFQLTLTFNGAVHTYQGECADVTISWLPERIVGRQVLCLFDVPVRPIALAGGF